jgi:L-threonylcarbamoyladenylate synthase
MTVDDAITSAVVRPADAAAIEQAAALIRDGKLVAFPTETVYGLGADATSARAVARIYAAKGRPPSNPLICHVDGIAAAQRQGIFAADACALAERFWPGPLTLVVPASATTSVCDIARASLATIALRVPAHPVAQALVQAVGGPIAAPSANPSGRVSATTAAHVWADFGRQIDLVLDAGATALGLESTIVGCDKHGCRLLRFGGIARAALEAVLGARLNITTGQRRGEQPAAPGMLASHYAPKAKLRLDAYAIAPGEAVLDFGAKFSTETALRLDLSPTGDLAEAAANLFARLRALDATGAAVIAVAPVPTEGLGEAINDVNRAALRGQLNRGADWRGGRAASAALRHRDNFGLTRPRYHPVADSLTNHGPRERRHIGDQPFGRIGLIFADETISLLAPVVAQQGYLHAKSDRPVDCFRPDEFGTGAPG